VFEGQEHLSNGIWNPVKMETPETPFNIYCRFVRISKQRQNTMMDGFKGVQTHHQHTLHALLPKYFALNLNVNVRILCRLMFIDKCMYSESLLCTLQMNCSYNMYVHSKPMY
jgi:hypothetical protein